MAKRKRKRKKTNGNGFAPTDIFERAELTLRLGSQYVGDSRLFRTFTDIASEEIAKNVTPKISFCLHRRCEKCSIAIVQLKTDPPPEDLSFVMVYDEPKKPLVASLNTERSPFFRGDFIDCPHTKRVCILTTQQFKDVICILTKTVVGMNMLYGETPDGEPIIRQRQIRTRTSDEGTADWLLTSEHYSNLQYV